MNSTEYPALQAAIPKAVARWVFPVPGLDVYKRQLVGGVLGDEVDAAADGVAVHIGGYYLVHFDVQKAHPPKHPR